MHTIVDCTSRDCVPPVKHGIAMNVQNVRNAHVKDSISGVQLLNNARILRNGKINDKL